jgi:hypothetical protein
MKDSHWKALSLSLTTALIVVVASWATAQTGSVGPGERTVIVEASKRRYVLTIGHRSAKEVDKYIMYDSWTLPETEEIWVLQDPHKAKSKWIRMPFSNKFK